MLILCCFVFSDNDSAISVPDRGCFFNVLIMNCIYVIGKEWKMGISVENGEYSVELFHISDTEKYPIVGGEDY